MHLFTELCHKDFYSCIRINCSYLCSMTLPYRALLFLFTQNLSLSLGVHAYGNINLCLDPKEVVILPHAVEALCN